MPVLSVFITHAHSLDRCCSITGYHLSMYGFLHDHSKMLEVRVAKFGIRDGPETPRSEINFGSKCQDLEICRSLQKQ